MSGAILIYGFLTICLILLFGLIGCGFLLVATRKKTLSVLELTSSPALGLALTAMQLWIYGLIGLPWNRITLLLPWLLIICVASRRLSYKKLRIAVNKLIRSLREMNSLAQLLLVISVVLLLAYAAMLIIQPLLSSDFLAIWGLKAKQFYFHQSVYVDPELYRKIEGAKFYHVDYPPLYPLMGDVMYVLNNSVSETLMKIVSFILLASGLTTLFGYLRHKVGQNKAFVFAFLFLGSPLFVPMLFVNKYMAYGDFPLTVLMMLATIFFLSSLSSKKYLHMVLALTFASFAASTKNEGLPFLLLISGLLVISNIRSFYPRNLSIKSSFKKVLLWVAILSPNVLWAIYKQRHHLTVDFSLANLANSGMSIRVRIATIRYFVWLYISTNPVFHWEVAALVLGAIGAVLRRSRESLYLLLLVCGMIASYVLSFVFSPYELGFHILSSIDRLLTQIFPIILLLLASIYFKPLTSAKLQPTSKN